MLRQVFEDLFDGNLDCFSSGIADNRLVLFGFGGSWAPRDCHVGSV